MSKGNRYAKPKRRNILKENTTVQFLVLSIGLGLIIGLTVLATNMSSDKSPKAAPVPATTQLQTDTPASQAQGTPEGIVAKVAWVGLADRNRISTEDARKNLRVACRVSDEIDGVQSGSCFVNMNKEEQLTLNFTNTCKSNTCAISVSNTEGPIVDWFGEVKMGPVMFEGKCVVTMPDDGGKKPCIADPV